MKRQRNTKKIHVADMDNSAHLKQNLFPNEKRLLKEFDEQMKACSLSTEKTTIKTCNLSCFCVELQLVLQQNIIKNKDLYLSLIAFMTHFLKNAVSFLQ